MYLADARQTKTEDPTDEELPSTSGSQFMGSNFTGLSNSQNYKVRWVSRICPFTLGMFSIACGFLSS